MSRVLITGAGGFIGRLLVADLLARGHHVFSVHHRKPPTLPTDDRHRNLQADLRSPLDLPTDIDWVVHAAAVTHLDPTLTATDYARTNVDGALHIARYVDQAAVRGVIYLSTLSVYGSIAGSCLRETEEPRSPNLYGRTKRLAEEILLDLPDNCDVLCLRLPGITGPGYFRAWIGQVLQALHDDRPVTYVNGDRPFNNLLDAGELNRLVDHVIRSDPIGHHVVNAAATAAEPLSEILMRMRELCGSRSELVDDGRRPPSFWIDTSKLEQITGFTPDSTRRQISTFVDANPRQQATASRPVLSLSA